MNTNTKKNMHSKKYTRTITTKKNKEAYPYPVHLSVYIIGKKYFYFFFQIQNYLPLCRGEDDFLSFVLEMRSFKSWI